MMQERCIDNRCSSMDSSTNTIHSLIGRSQCASSSSRSALTTISTSQECRNVALSSYLTSSAFEIDNRNHRYQHPQQQQHLENPNVRHKVTRLWHRFLGQSTSHPAPEPQITSPTESKWSSTLSLHSNWLSLVSIHSPPKTTISSSSNINNSNKSMQLSVASFLLPSASSIWNYYHGNNRQTKSNYSLFDSDDEDDYENYDEDQLYLQGSSTRNSSNLISTYRVNQQSFEQFDANRRSSYPSHLIYPQHLHHQQQQHQQLHNQYSSPPPPYQLYPQYGTMLTCQSTSELNNNNRHLMVNDNLRTSTVTPPPPSPPPPYSGEDYSTDVTASGRINTTTLSDVTPSTRTEDNYSTMVAILAVHDHCSSPISISHCPVIASTPLITKLAQSNSTTTVNTRIDPINYNRSNNCSTNLKSTTTASSSLSSSYSASSTSPPQYALFDISEYESIDVNHDHNSATQPPPPPLSEFGDYFHNGDYNQQQLNCFHRWNPFCLQQLSNLTKRRQPQPPPPPSSSQQLPSSQSFHQSTLSSKPQLTTDDNKANLNHNNNSNQQKDNNNNKSNSKSKHNKSELTDFSCKLLLTTMAIATTLLMFALFVAFGPIDGLAKHRLTSPSLRLNSASNSPVKSSLSSVSGLKLPAKQPGVCHTDVCRKAGRQLYQSINFTVNPCDNFYEYACGMWVHKNPVPADKSRISTFSTLDETLKINLRTVLEYGRKKAVSKRKVANNAVSVQYAIELYHECMDRDSVEKLDIVPIQQLMNELFGQWPVLKPAIARAESTNDAWQETFVNYFTKTAISPIFSVSIQPDSNKTTTKRIHFDAPEFGLGRKEYKDVTSYNDTVEAYKLYMNRIGKLFSGSDLDKVVQERFLELFEFESKLALASTPQEDRRDASVWYNPMTLAELKNLTNNLIDWTAVLNAILVQTKANIDPLTDQDMVIVNDIPYYKAVSVLVNETPEYIINNYLGWILISSVADYASDRLYDIEFQHNKVVTGIKQKPPIWRRCVKQVYGELSLAISRLYIDKFVNRETKQKATQLIKSLKESFDSVVREGEWLDQITKERSVEKLNSMRENVAYPDWIEDNSELDKYYGMSASGNVQTSDVVKGKYFESFIKIRQVILTSQWSKLNNPVNLTTSWPMPPAIVNAAYDPTQNSITIPVGILYPPFFDAGRPASMNFGGIGTVIGHEITHGFDDQGRQFDNMGNLVDWWTEETKKRFNVGSKCFVDQYGAIKDSSTKKNLNGANTVGENIADNGGLRESYRAYQNYVENSPNQESSLPYLNKFTSNQIFFLSYANIWCGSARPEMLSMLIDYDPHSPGKYRINVPISNFFDEFSRAFNCPVNSPMNAKNRCQLW